ncbi:hypothetical protein BZA05DRAFT_445643 [Tricharina praecox]|uniref:uncharacterized protein n=1 Tax=Tricharina praecox TaxID=43433 RepID=UPI00222075B2|nr:uncharacterized protein BZA05DRAFT_445643 [Tricharina praecox]KAI5850803.1 hypothetical protein BZA05DRAFT_445643 [Tricharina praecox]
MSEAVPNGSVLFRRRRTAAQVMTLWAEFQQQTWKGKDRFKIRDLFADERCSKGIPEFPSTTDMGRRMPEADVEDAASEVSEWELREREGRAELRRLEEEEEGAEVQGEEGGEAEEPNDVE